MEQLKDITKDKENELKMYLLKAKVFDDKDVNNFEITYSKSTDTSFDFRINANEGFFMGKILMEEPITIQVTALLKDNRVKTTRDFFEIKDDKVVRKSIEGNNEEETIFNKNDFFIKK